MSQRMSGSVSQARCSVVEKMYGVDSQCGKVWRGSQVHSRRKGGIAQKLKLVVVIHPCHI